MTIKIIHPTKGRRQQALTTCYQWLMKASSVADIEYYFSIDTDDPEDWEDSIRILPRQFRPGLETKNATVIKNDNKTAIQAINYAAKVINNNTPVDDNYLLIVVSDDFACDWGWDSKLCDPLLSKFDFFS